MHTQKCKHIKKKDSSFPWTWNPSQPTVALYLDLVLYYGNTEECSPDPQTQFGHLSVYTETHFILPRVLLYTTCPKWMETSLSGGDIVYFHFQQSSYCNKESLGSGFCSPRQYIWTEALSIKALSHRATDHPVRVFS